jgi:hypothetical protein
MAVIQKGGLYRVGSGLDARYVDSNGAPAVLEGAEKPEEQAYPYADLLKAKGFETWEKVKAAKDEDLLGDGIGPARLAEIRAFKG